MIFRQFFHQASSTYTYLLACDKTKEAIIIDPVSDHLSHYMKIISELGLKLIYGLDTHIHADHITALGDLREQTQCITLMGSQAQAACISDSFNDGDQIDFGNLHIKALYTPGHTDDSYSFVMSDRVFTGDTLLIRGTGRTDFQAGNAEQSWDSIHNKLFTLADETLVYPGHDYKGWTVSSIGEEKKFNPRLANKTKQEYIEIMNNLNLPNPSMMDIAVPSNQQCGKL